MRVRTILLVGLALVLTNAGVQAQDTPVALGAKGSQVRVASPVDGIIQEVLVKVGDRVKRGDILARLDDRLAKIEVQIARVMLQGAEAGLLEAEATLKHADARLQRVKALARTNVISQEEVLSAEVEAQKARSGIESKRARIELARLQMKKAEILLDMHTLRSPVDGVIRRMTHGIGEGIGARQVFAAIDPRDNPNQK